MIEQHESIIDADKSRTFDWREFWEFKELFYFFTWRDIKIKYKQTLLGFLWVVLQPLLMMVIFTFFFAKALKLPAHQLPYPVFVLSGLLIWNTFASGLVNAANSMVNNSAIIRKIYFPRLIIPVSAVLGAIFDFIIAFLLFIVLLVIYQQPVSLHAIWCWPASIVIATIATLGPGSLLAALSVKFRDFRYVIPFLVQILFFISPVIYPVSVIKYEILKYAIAASPLYAAIELFRYPLLSDFPDVQSLTISSISCLLFLFIGVRYFRSTEDFFADFA